jgi:hypothetical protein
MIDPDNRYGRELKASEEFFRFGQDHSLAFYAQLLSMRRRAVSFFRRRTEDRALSRPAGRAGKCHVTAASPPRDLPSRAKYGRIESRSASPLWERPLARFWGGSTCAGATVLHGPDRLAAPDSASPWRRRGLS